MRKKVWHVSRHTFPVRIPVQQLPSLLTPASFTNFFKLNSNTPLDKTCMEYIYEVAHKDKIEEHKIKKKN